MKRGSDPIEPGIAAPVTPFRQVEIERIIAILKEHAFATIAALGHMMRYSGQDDAAKPGHGA